MADKDNRLLQAIKQRVEELTEKVEELEKEKLKGFEFSASRVPDVSESRTKEYTEKTANYTLTNTDAGLIYGDTDGGDFTLTLPAAPTDGLHFTITNTGSSGNTLTIARNGKTINGQSEDLPIGDSVSVTLHYTINGWIIIN